MKDARKLVSRAKAMIGKICCKSPKRAPKVSKTRASRTLTKRGRSTKPSSKQTQLQKSRNKKQRPQTKAPKPKDSADYYNNQPATINGVLGGFGQEVHEPDCETSRQMIKKYKDLMPGLNKALDCGAGVGRVTEHVLKPLFREVDLVEPLPKFLKQAKKNVPEARNFYLEELQDHKLRDKYDAIWLQWVLPYAEDKEIERFLKSAKRRGLTSGSDGKTGLIFVKDNVADVPTPNKEDHSVMRTHKQFVTIFKKCGFKILQDTVQKDVPEKLHQIRCFVLKPQK